MNWRKGFLRLWLIVSIAWVTFWVVAERPYENARLYMRINKGMTMMASALSVAVDDEIYIPTTSATMPRAKVEYDFRKLHAARKKTQNVLVDFAKFTLIPVFALLAFGVLVGWAILGFRQR